MVIGEFVNLKNPVNMTNDFKRIDEIKYFDYKMVYNMFLRFLRTDANIKL